MTEEAARSDTHAALAQRLYAFTVTPASILSTPEAVLVQGRCTGKLVGFQQDVGTAQLQAAMGYTPGA